MSSFFVRRSQVHPGFDRLAITILFLAFTAFIVAPAKSHAQFGAPAAGTQVLDATALKPPVGARVAIVEFADMECPRCGKENPVVKAAAAKYRILWIRHDFLIPGHIWSPAAAVNARWFDTKSKALGDEYRDQVFANQSSIYNPDALRQFTEKFAADHGIALPFAIDPQGKLAADVNADKALGLRTGIFQTPTIFIVTANSKGAPFIEVQNPDQDLYRIIDQAIADTASSTKAALPAPTKPAEATASKPAETGSSAPVETESTKSIETQPPVTPAASQQQVGPAASKDTNPHAKTWLFGTPTIGVIVVIFVVAMKRRQRH